MKTLLILLVGPLIWAQTPSPSCTDSLRRQVWPVDCLLEAKIKSVSTKRLNQWCDVHKMELMKSLPPTSFLGLNPPAHCKSAALKSQSHFNALKLITNSF